MDFGFTAAPAIAVICFLLAEIVKASRLDNKFVPITCGVLGGVLGILAMFLIPDYPATDYMTAAAIGVVSGFAATGIHQVGKQLSSNTDEASGPGE